ncbi:MAG: hypothetical protein OXC95_15155 [Dehalococcoidia bacterium]|nr:hypothetical protein [Dehalococcoidia bacterium]
MVAAEERVSRLEGAYEQVDGRSVDLRESVCRLRADLIAGLDNLEARLDRMESKLNAILIGFIVMAGGVWSALILLWV